MIKDPECGPLVTASGIRKIVKAGIGEDATLAVDHADGRYTDHYGQVRKVVSYDESSYAAPFMSSVEVIDVVTEGSEGFVGSSDRAIWRLPQDALLGSAGGHRQLFWSDFGAQYTLTLGQ